MLYLRFWREPAAPSLQPAHIPVQADHKPPDIKISSQKGEVAEPTYILARLLPKWYHGKSKDRLVLHTKKD